MSTPQITEATTQGIRIGAAAFYLPAESDPLQHKYLFGYRILIVNEGDQPAQLLSRHWIIIDALGRREDVEGPGVVGQTPRLEPGQGFKYNSFCPLRTEWGTMEGTFAMRRDNGELFDATVARFYLNQQVIAEVESD